MKMNAKFKILVVFIVMLIGIVGGLKDNITYAYTDADFVTQWTIPVDADGTAGGGTTIKLPIPKNTNNSFKVNWGDGRTQTFDNTADFPTHTYTNTIETTYTIQIIGTVNSFGYNKNSSPTSTNVFKNYYTFTQYLTRLTAWGELRATQYGFSYCINLTGEIPEPTENSFTSVTDFSFMFYNCNNLSGIIPATLFGGCTNVTNFYGIFYNCSGLSGIIPATLFSGCTSVTSFDSTFYNCSGLSGTIPATLFSDCTSVTKFAYTFYRCSSLSGTIPATLFHGCTSVITFNSTFAHCTGLSETIPSELFSGCASVTIFDNTFAHCTGLSGTIPSELFSGCTNVTNFQGTFSFCRALSGPIPAELFSDCTSAANFKNTFYDCNSLSGKIPATLFSGCTSATSFDSTFANCTGLSGTIPATLFNDCPSVTSFYSTFSYCRGLSGTIPAELFSGCTGVTNFGGTFYNCSGLSGTIPAELFNDCTSATSFTRTFAGSGLNSIPSGLFSGCTNVTNFDSTFEQCTNLRGSIPEDLFSGCTSVTSFNTTFFNCTGLTGTIPATLFTDCTNVTSFYRTFYNCSGLSAIIPARLFSSNVGITTNTSTSNGYAQTFYGCIGVTRAELDTKFVGFQMFYGCNNLKEITISDKLEGIYGTSGAFRYTGSNPSILPTTLNTTKEVALNYSWTADKRAFDINYNADFTVLTTEYTYDGTEKKPEISDVVRDGVTLVKDTDYVIAYKNNIGAGTASVVVAGIGLYTGTIERDFTILPKEITITAKDQKIAYGENLVNDANSITVETLVDGHSVTSIVLEPSSVEEGTGTITPSEVQIIEGDYDVTANYNSTYKVGKLTVEGKPDISNATVTLVPTSFEYDGSAKTPTATVVYDGQTLTKDTDYTVTYENNVNAGTATAVITGKENFSGVARVNFTITKKQITKPTLSDSVVAYNGQEQTASLDGFDSNTMIVTNNTMTDAGYRTVIVTLKNKNYVWEDGTTGNVLMQWEIVPMPIIIDWTDTELIYNGLYQKPTATVETGIDGETIVVSVSPEAKDVGEYTATAKIEKVEGGRGRITNYKLQVGAPL